MSNVSGENVYEVAKNINEMAKMITISTAADENAENDLIAAARGKDANKRALTTDDDASTALLRARESRAQKLKRGGERREAFEEYNRKRKKEKDMRERRRSAADLQNLRAQT
ncbi:hypothetical protein FGB62_8g27 [Gracilaria domingensis]|nr:hypothetical protein FGB62_8g27 [Gracilaria domingensis]